MTFSLALLNNAKTPLDFRRISESMIPKGVPQGLLRPLLASDCVLSLLAAIELYCAVILRFFASAYVSLSFWCYWF